MRNIVDADVVTVLSVPPGTGKSYAALRRLCELGRGTFAAPTYKLLHEHIELCKNEWGLQDYTISLPLTAKDPDGNLLCVRPAAMRYVLRQGHSPRHRICKTCPYQTGCDPYIGRKDVGAGGIYFATHAALSRDYLSDTYNLPRPIVIDELPSPLSTLRVHRGQLQEAQDHVDLGRYPEYAEILSQLISGLPLQHKDTSGRDAVGEDLQRGSK